MGYSISGFIAIFFVLLLMALVVALIFRRDFRDAVLGGPGEASIAGIITIKGVVIVLLCGLLIGGILFALTQLQPTQLPGTTTQSIPVRINVHFEPNEVNPRHPDFRIKAYIKTREGPEPIEYIHKLNMGALSVKLNVPDMETPFFIVFETPRGTWQTDDFSIHETAAAARKQVIVQ